MWESFISTYRGLFLLFTALTIILPLFQFSLQQALAEPLSPFFGLQDIRVQPHNWIDVYNEKYVNNGANYTDLQDISYYSDGRFLNATLWLASFNPTPPTDRNVNYGMYIDADMNNNTGIAGVDYHVEIQWHGETKTWTKVFEQWSSSGLHRTLDIKPIKGFFSKKGEAGRGAYVLLDADLKQMLWPKRYRVLFYAEEVNNPKLFWIVSPSKWVYIPPPEFIISTSPGLVNIRAGEESTIEVEVKSTKGSDPSVHLSSANEQPYYLKLNFTYPNIRIPSSGIGTTQLVISTSKEAPISPYTIVISADFTLPPDQAPFRLPNGQRTLQSQPIRNQSTVVVNVGEPLNAMDRISDFWNKLGSFINFVYLVGGAAASWVFTRYVGKKEK